MLDMCQEPKNISNNSMEKEIHFKKQKWNDVNYYFIESLILTSSSKTESQLPIIPNLKEVRLKGSILKKFHHLPDWIDY